MVCAAIFLSLGNHTEALCQEHVSTEFSAFFNLNVMRAANTTAWVLCEYLDLELNS